MSATEGLNVDTLLDEMRALQRSYGNKVTARLADMEAAEAVGHGAETGRPAGTLDEDGQPPELQMNVPERHYHPNSFVARWLERYPDTTLRDLHLAESDAPLRSVLPTQAAEAVGGDTSPAPDVLASLATAAQPTKPAELHGLGITEELAAWIAGLRELQAQGRTSAADWTVAEQAQVEGMIREEMTAVQAAAEHDDQRSHARITGLQSIAEHLADISGRAGFRKLGSELDPEAPIDVHITAIERGLSDWLSYCQHNDDFPTGGKGGGRDADAPSALTASRRTNKANQVASGIAAAASHEGILLTAQQLDQVLKAFYEQQQRAPPPHLYGPQSTAGGSGAGANNEGAPAIRDRALVRLARQAAGAQAREESVRRTLVARNKFLMAEVARLERQAESLAKGERPQATGGRPSMPGDPAGTSVVGAPATTAADAGFVQLMVASVAGGNDYGVSTVLRNRSAVESLNTITMAVAEALSRKRVRQLQDRLEQLRQAVATMKQTQTQARDRVQELAAENFQLRCGLKELSVTMDRWRAAREAQEAERRRIAREGGSELDALRHLLSSVVQRTTAAMGNLLRHVDLAVRQQQQLQRQQQQQQQSHLGAEGSLSPPLTPGGTSDHPHRRRSSISTRRLSAQLEIAEHLGADHLHNAAEETREWVSRMMLCGVSDATRMLLLDLERKAAATIAAAALHAQTAATCNPLSPHSNGDGSVQRTASRLVGSGAAPATTTTEHLAAIESLSSKLDQTVCEVKNKFREARYMRSTVRYFARAVEEMAAGTFHEVSDRDDSENDDDGASLDGTARDRSGGNSPLSPTARFIQRRLRRKSNIGRRQKAFPPRKITGVDSEYAYAWADECQVLQRLFITLKGLLMHEVERTEATNAIVHTLEAYEAHGPAFRTVGAVQRDPIKLPPIGRTGTTAAGQQQQQQGGGSTPAPQQSPAGAGGAGRASVVGDPVGLLQQIKGINLREQERLQGNARKGSE